MGITVNYGMLEKQLNYTPAANYVWLTMSKEDGSTNW